MTDVESKWAEGGKTSLVGYGIQVLGGTLQDVADTGTVTLAGDATLTGLSTTPKDMTATAAGLYMNGGKTLLDKGTTETVTVTGTVTTVAPFTGEATAYGACLTNGAQLSVTATLNAQSSITGTFGTQVENTTGTQTAYGIYADNASITLAGGTNGIKVEGLNLNTIADENESTITSYGIFAVTSQIELTGKIDITATASGGDTENYVADAINATDSAISVGPGTTTATGNVILNQGTLGIEGSPADGSTGGVDAQLTIAAGGDFNGTDVSSIKLLGGNASSEAKGGAAGLTLTEGDFTVSGTPIEITAGDAAATGNFAGGAATLTLTKGTASITGKSVTITGGNAGAGNIGADASISITAGAATDVSTFKGTEITLTGGEAATGKAGGNASINVATGALSIVSTPVQLTGGAASSDAAGGAASITVAGATTITGGSEINLTGGTPNADQKGGAATATFTGGLTLGAENQTDTSSITVGANSTLTIGPTAVANAYNGTTITIENGGTLTGPTGDANTNVLNINEGATLILENGATMSGNSTVAGTLKITGTTEEASEGVGGPYMGGLGNMTVSGNVTSDGPLYLQLATGGTPDELTFENGSSMTAAQVGVGNGTGSTTAKLTVNGGDITIDELIVGGETAKGELAVTGGNLTVNESLEVAAVADNKVTLSGGFLTLGDPTVSGEEVTSVLDIGSGSTFEIKDDGVLVTNSQNLFEQAANSKDIEAGTGTVDTVGGTITYSGGYIELTDKTVEQNWLAAAEKVVGSDTQFILDGQLVSGGKTVNLMPSNPTNGKLPTNAVPFAGGMLLGNSLNANPFTSLPTETGGKTTSYQNLIIGTLSNSRLLPWTDQPEGTTQWTINPEKQIGFASIQIGDGNKILIIGENPVVLAGTGTEIVSGNNVTLYVGTQQTTPTAENAGTLILGYTPTSALGGALNGNLTVYDGSVQVKYGAYTVTGALTLGQEKTTTYSATPGSLQIANKGTLTVGSITGANVGNGTNPGISITDGSTLTVNGAMDVTLATITGDADEFSIEGSTLNVGQALSVKTAPNAQPVVMVASDNSTVTAASLTANNVLIGLDGSTMTINGPFEQTGKNLVLAAVGTSTLSVNGDLTTQATTVWINDSTVTANNGILSIGQAAEGTAQATPTNLILDGATINAGTINLTNVNTALFDANTFDGDTDAEMTGYVSYYESGDITATSMNLAGSNIMLNSGSLTVNGTLSVNAASTLGLGGISAEALAAIPEASQPTTLVTNASIGTLNLEGGLAINGLAPADGGQTQVAIGALNFVNDTTEETGGDLTVGGNAAVMFGSSKVADLPTWVKALNDNKPTTMTAAITNYLVAGQSVNVGDYNTVTIGENYNGATVTPGNALTIGDGVAVAVDGKLLASATNNKQVSLFKYNGAANTDNLPTAVISQTAYFLVTNPLGNVDIKVADGFDTEGVELLDSQLAKTNPLYEVNWLEEDPAAPANLGERVAGDEEDAEEPVASTTIAVRISETSVHNILNSLGDNSVIDAAQNLGYGNGYIGADTLLGIIAGVTDDPATVIEARNAINTIALRGAAAHAHEIGISAASMVVDSVWDHGSKLAAAPHEEAKGDVWITLDWNHSRANDYKAGGLDNGYKLDLYGATFGADYDFANGLAAGLAVSVGGGEAKSKGFNAGQKTDVTYWGINLYGTYTSPIVNVIGNVGYIGITNKTKVNGDKGRPDANIWTIGVKAEKDFAINEQFTVTPHVGIRYLSVDVDDFNLQGFHYGTDKANLVQFPIGVAFAANLKTANGAAVKPFLDLSFVPTAGDKNVNNTFGIQGGTMNDVIDTTIASGAMFQGKIGVNASYGAHNFGLNFAIGGGNKGRLDTGLQAKYRFVF